METALLNPFREDDLRLRKQAAPCTLIIFGATGDLTHRKLIPALYNLAVDGDLPSGLKIIGFARKEKSDQEFRDGLRESNEKVSRREPNETHWNSFSQCIHYHQSSFDDPAGFAALKQKLEDIEAAGGSPNRLYYLASGPEQFKEILEQLKASQLNDNSPRGWSRVVVEKPFGTDLASARSLNEVVNNTFHEADTYRIDHYLGKETAQNIMVLRFTNAIFEQLWNNHCIDHIQVTCAEDLGMEGGRGGYYDKSGALRDMVQNHLLQLICLIAMEPPVDLGADGVRDEKVKVLKSLRRYRTPEEVAANSVRAQYSAGEINFKAVVGYRQEDRVDPQSMTESYVALRLFIDNWRWGGVPFYLRVGKRLPKKATEISIHFKKAPDVLFNAINPDVSRENVLVIRIQPDEGISLAIRAKCPGSAPTLIPVKMDFRYQTSFGKSSPEAYERLLLDAIAGDATLFARKDEVEEAWKFVDHIEEAWSQRHTPIRMDEYAAGSWGPVQSDHLLALDQRKWRRL